MAEGEDRPSGLRRSCGDGGGKQFRLGPSRPGNAAAEKVLELGLDGG